MIVLMMAYITNGIPIITTILFIKQIDLSLILELNLKNK